MTSMQQPRPQRKPRTSGPSMRQQNRQYGNNRYDRNVNAQTDGVYGNARMTYTATAIVGCPVQVTVKKGTKYEGIFRTFSPKMDIVLECVHEVRPQSANAVPTKNEIICKAIFENDDVVCLTALNCDLEYATKENVQESKSPEAETSPVKNGVSDDNMPMRELEKWEDDEQGVPNAAALEATDNSNGWDANEMFKQNESKFNVKSTYDSDLKQYTTQLRHEDTQEFRRKERAAERAAREIERCDASHARLELENDDGRTEEERWSSVRGGGAGSGGAPSTTGGNGESKYIPPQLRRGGAGPQRPVPANAAAARARNNEEEVDGPQQQQQAAAMASHPPNHQQQRRDNKIKEFIKFSSEFKLQEKGEPGSSPQTAGPTSPPVPGSALQAASPVQASTDATSATPSPASPSPVATPADKTASPDNATASVVKTSTLNPNAKEFTFNPNAKPFTPAQPAPVNTPPRPTAQSPGIMAPPGPQINPLIHQTGVYPLIPQVSMAPTTPVVQNQRPPFPKRAALQSFSDTVLTMGREARGRELRNAWPGSYRQPRQGLLQLRPTMRINSSGESAKVVVSVDANQSRPPFSAQAAAAAATGQPLLPVQTPVGQQTQPFQYSPYVVSAGAQPGVQQQMIALPGTQLVQSVVPSYAGAGGGAGGGPAQDGGQNGAAGAAGSGPQQPPQTLYVSPQPGTAQAGPPPAAAAAAAAVAAQGGQGHTPAHMAPHHQHAANQQTAQGNMAAAGGPPHPTPSPVHPPTSATPQPAIVYQAPSHMGQQPVQLSPTSPQAGPVPSYYPGGYYQPPQHQQITYPGGAVPAHPAAAAQHIGPGLVGAHPAQGAQAQPGAHPQMMVMQGAQHGAQPHMGHPSPAQVQLQGQVPGAAAHQQMQHPMQQHIPSHLQTTPAQFLNQHQMQIYMQQQQQQHLSAQTGAYPHNQ